MTDQELAIYIGLKIKEFRDQRGLTQKELADLIEMGNTTIANYEKGFRTPKKNTLFKIANALNVTIDDLFPILKQSDNSIIESVGEILSQLDPEPYQHNVLTYAEGQLEEQMQANMATYQRFQTEHINVLENDRTLFDWASKQTYIALANMMTGAALIGIDSCPIEGFNYAEVNRILAQTGAYDAEKYAVSVAVTFGYRAKDIRPKSRKPLNEIVHWIE